MYEKKKADVGTKDGLMRISHRPVCEEYAPKHGCGTASFPFCLLLIPQ